MARVVGKLWIQDAVDGGMTDEEIHDRSGVLAVAFHADRQRLDPAQHEIAVER